MKHLLPLAQMDEAELTTLWKNKLASLLDWRLTTDTLSDQLRELSEKYTTTLRQKERAENELRILDKEIQRRQEAAQRAASLACATPEKDDDPRVWSRLKSRFGIRPKPKR